MPERWAEMLPALGRNAVLHKIVKCKHDINTAAAELAKIIGTEDNQLVSRPQVTKKLWAYVIFGTEKIKCFDICSHANYQIDTVSRK